ncbi:hypothetical protein Ccrd_011447, partial [Cynara cardunculus var. scolymus]
IVRQYPTINTLHHFHLVLWSLEEQIRILRFQIFKRNLVLPSQKPKRSTIRSIWRMIDANQTTKSLTFLFMFKG